MAGRGDESVAQLLANLPPRVRQLRLASKSITAVGADAIAAALSTPTCGVRSVSLECNQLGNEGARALAAVALGAAALTSLALGDNCIGADGLAALLDAVASGALLELDLGNSLLDGRRHNRFRADGSTTQALAACIASSQLTQLNLRGCGLDHRYEAACVAHAIMPTVLSVPLPSQTLPGSHTACLLCCLRAGLYQHYRPAAGGSRSLTSPLTHSGRPQGRWPSQHWATPPVAAAAAALCD
jgi:hypothetical protein